MKKVEDYEVPAWRIGYCWRETGLLEDVCEHGVGHPNQDFLKKEGWPDVWSVHGCDGCCHQLAEDV